MGTFSMVMEVGDLSEERFAAFRGLVDTGSTLTTLPEGLLRTLGVEPVRQVEFELGDERVVEYGVGHAVIRYNGETVANPVAFAPNDAEPIIGAVTLESLGLAVDPVRLLLKQVRCRPAVHGGHYRRKT